MWFYYRQPIFRAFHYLRFLIIVVEAPLTIESLLQPLDLYYIHKVPLVSPTSVNHYTVLAADLHAVLYHRDVEYYMSLAQPLEISDTGILHLKRSSSLLQTRNVQSCALLLLEGSLIEIKKYCRYHLVAAPIPRSVIKIDHNTFLLTNISSVTVTCLNHNISNTFVPPNIQSVFAVHCGCILQADGFVVVATSLYCPFSDNLTLSFEPKFILNLPYISEFVQADILNVLQQIDYLNKTIPIEFPPLSIASKEYQAHLAIEDHSKFDLERIINQTKDDQLSFDDLSHYVYSVLLSSHTHNKDFDYLNVLDWFLILATIAGFLALILALVLHFKVRPLFLLLASSGRTHALPVGQLLPTGIYFDTKTSSTPPDIDPHHYQNVIKDVFPVDVSILLCFILFIIGFIIYLFFKRQKRVHAKTTLVLEIGNMYTTFRWTVAKLSYSAGYYRIIISQIDTIRLRESFLNLQILWGEGLNIVNTALNLPVNVSPVVNVECWTAYKVRGLMNGSFYAAIHILSHDDVLVDVFLLKHLHGRALVGDVPSHTSTLYPSRELEAVTG